MSKNKKVTIQDIKLSEVSDEAKKLAKLHFDSAKILANEGKYSSAYIFLVFALEESAKAKICTIYKNFRHQNQGIGGTGVPLNQHIKNESVERMFWDHKSKQLIMLTQSLLELKNTNNKIDFKKVSEAITKEDPFLVPEVGSLMKLFNSVQTRREDACYVKADGSGLSDFKNDYESLLPHVESAIDGLNQFVARKFENYWETEKHIKKMKKKI